MSGRQFGLDTEAIQLFHRNLRVAIDAHGEVTEPEARYQRQKYQMETLVALEKEFRQTLIAHSWGNYVYRRFVKHICEERRNILAARPYFRERQDVFTKDISKALKRREEKSLYRFHFNFLFVLFVMEARPWKPHSPIMRLYRRIEAMRRELVEMNMPLAVNQARLFFSKTPPSHLTYMDFIQIAAEGLMSGVDKFCLPFSSRFRPMAIGRMLGNFIEDYSATLIHYYPADKRKLYRANKFSGKHVNGIDHERLAKEVNLDQKTGGLVDRAYRTTPEEIAALMAASSTVSADTGTVPGVGRGHGGEEFVDVPKLVDRFEAPEETRPDFRAEEGEAMGVMMDTIHEGEVLTPFEQKFLRLRGISLPAFVVQ